VAERLLIDTDVLIEYLRGRGEAVEYLESLTSDLYLSVISVAELFAVVEGDEEGKSLEQLLQAFVVLPVTEKVARLGGRYRRQYRPSHGTGLADALIAATSEECGANLVTFNRRHFPMILGLTVPYER
jgi:predicted nucleic acid-binding protein